MNIPRLFVKWGEKKFNFFRGDCFTALQDRDPSIVALHTPLDVSIVTWMMVLGEEKLAARKLKEVLEHARLTAQQRPRRTGAELAAASEMDNPVDEWDPISDGLLPQYRGAAGE